MFNSPNTTIAVRSKAGTKVTVDCVSKTVKKKGGQTFVVNRSPDSLQVILSRDSIIKEVWIKPRTSRTGYMNVLNLGLGFKKDRRSPRQYTFPPNIWVPLDESGNRYYTENPARKGMFGIHLSVPLANCMYFRINGSEDRSEVLPPGFILGADYGVSSDKYWSFDAGISFNFTIGEHVAPGIETNYPHWISYFTVRKNHILGAFSLGYGLDFSHYHWERTDRIRTSTGFTELNKAAYCNTGIGPVLSGYLNMGPVIAIGIKYHTQILSYSDQFRLRYGHVITFETQFNFPLRKKFIYN